MGHIGLIFVCILVELVVLTVTESVSSRTYIYVDVEQGTLMGETVDFTENEFLNISKKINVFKGVPYADPPVRFKPPKRRKRWGEWDATRYRDVCPQSEAGSFESIEEFTVSEDCLYLNVYAPDNTEGLMPVMVFIHGGSFARGTSMTSDYSGIPIAVIGDVVVVTINYRLGVFGFLDTGHKAASGNYGLLDQAEAMRWVRQNIEAFGGDSRRITLFGESAGASSVHYHMLSEYSRDLFDQAVLQSGTALSDWSFHGEENQARKAETASEIGRGLGCDTDDMKELIVCLRQVPWHELHNVSLTVGYTAKPTIDGDFLTDSPERLMARGEVKHCPITIGFNGNEGALLMSLQFWEYAHTDRPFITKALVDQVIGELETSSLMTAAILQQYLDWSEVGNEQYDYYDTLEKIVGDHPFACPALKVAKTHAQISSEPVFLYHMTHVPTKSIFTSGPTWLRAGHAEELRYAFGYNFIPGIKELRGPMTDEEIEFTVKFIRFWTNFARSGDPSRRDPSSPSGEGEWAWPRFTIPERQYKELSLQLAVRRGLKANECAFWNDFAPKLKLHLASQDEVESDWRDEFSDWRDDLAEWRRAFKKFEDDNSCI